MLKRNYAFDLMRILACIMIICMHAPLPSKHADALLLSAVSYFTAPGLCLFFVISGALLLPVKTDTRSFLRKRLGKVVMPTLCFTILYLLLHYFAGFDVNWMRSICSVPFSAQGHGILWFMYTLIGLYLVAPILSRWLDSASKREELFYLTLWAVSLCYPILAFVVDVNVSDTGILYYFSGYVGYFVLGHFMNKYPDVITLKRLTLPTLVALVAPVACRLLHLEVDFYSVFWYLSIFVAVLCVSVYKLVSIFASKLIVSDNLRSIIVLTSNLSFGIYLSHIAVMRFFVWKLDWVVNIDNYSLQWVVIVLLTFTLSWIVSYLFCRLPFGDYIIGFKQKC